MNNILLYIIIIVAVFYFIRNKPERYMSEDEINKLLIKRYTSQNPSKPVYGDWTSWSTCTPNSNNTMCGGKGIKQRERKCLYGKCDSTLLAQKLDCNVECEKVLLKDDYIKIRNMMYRLYSYSKDFIQNKFDSVKYEKILKSYDSYSREVYKNLLKIYLPNILQKAEQQIKQELPKDTIQVIQEAMKKLFASGLTTIKPTPIKPTPINPTTIPPWITTKPI